MQDDNKKEYIKRQIARQTAKAIMKESPTILNILEYLRWCLATSNRITEYNLFVIEQAFLKMEEKANAN